MSEAHDPAKLQDYHVHNITYKVVAGHNIELSIVVPKALVDKGVKVSKKFPIIAEFHGGALVSGSRLYSPWLSTWLLELAQLKGAILISPDYRLLPEANGLDVLEDLASFWSWYSEQFESTLANLYPGLNIQPHFDQLLIHGGSAGGYLAAQSVLLHPEVNAKAVIMSYPMIDLRDEWWWKDFERPVFGMAENVPIDVFEQHVKNMTPGTVVSSDGAPDRAVALSRLPLALSIIQHGKFLEYYGDDTKLFPLENLPRVHKLPPFVWVMHGKQDCLVPFKESELLVKEIQKHHPDANLRFDAHDGDHGFDNQAGISISSGWMKEGAAELLKHW
ncbi:hypothetical protein N7468_003395 [Penicillium chermesinum]|uniref:Alpha/beta hydrolase fold-3 domain-containing protein n=1 Tax=Penicillium chermesinum TaxID=63820 RepID=A0A9W9TRJ5_9EURO|nr:uncharacterized protein N7468_003395 [Penicillium chermesinum]KAJ5238776.1 hypothetical protein N7468_003395 [Penicillium chermesinum]